MKIVVYHEEANKKAYYARVVQAVAEKMKMPCEIFGCTSAAAARAALQDSDAADMYLLEGNGDGLKLALQLRNQTYVPSIIFLVPAEMPLPELLRSRPSGIQLADEPKEVVLALKYSFLEYGRRKRHLVIRSKEAVYRLPIGEITYLESCQRLVIVHTEHRKLQFYGKLAEVLASLPAEQFIRCHQSYAVNMEKVQTLNKALHHFRMADGEQVEISKAYYHAAAEQFETFLARQ